MGAAPVYLEIAEIRPCRKRESEGQGMLLRKQVGPNHHEMILPLFCVWLPTSQNLAQEQKRELPTDWPQAHFGARAGK